MEALILTCGTGGGHNTAAYAIAENMRSEGHEAVVLNPYTLHSSQLAESINRLYIKTVQKAPKIFGAAYTAGELYRKLPGRSPVYFANRGMVPIMNAYLEQKHFDIIITTHLFPAEILTYMKQKGQSVPGTIFIATDYECIPFTEETDCDAYVIPSEDLKQTFIDRGLPAEKLYPLGIPVSRRFSQSIGRAEACEKLGLDPDVRYILAAGGSMGGGSIKKMIGILSREIAPQSNTELIVLCGSNRQLYDELCISSLPSLKPVSFTSDMALYLKACDIFITKPGGLSSTEAAVSGIPIIHVASIPGCEVKNAGYFSRHEMSIFCRTTEAELSKALKALKSESARIRMRNTQKIFIPCDAAARITALAEKMI